MGAILSGVDILQDLDPTRANDEIDLGMALSKFLTTGDKITGLAIENSSHLPLIASASGLIRVDQANLSADEHDNVQTRCTSLSNLSGLNNTFTFELSLPKKLAAIYLPNSKAADIEAAAGDHILITYTITLSDMTKDPLATGCGSTGIVGLTSGTGTLSDNQSESVSELSGVYRGRYDLSMQFLGETLREAASANNTVCLEARPDTPVGRNEICGDCGEELNNRPANPEKLLVGAILSGVDILQDLDPTRANDEIDLGMALSKFLTTGDKITGLAIENSSHLPLIASASGLIRVDQANLSADEHDNVQTRCTSLSNLSGLNNTFTFELSLPKKLAAIYLPNSKAADIEAAAGDHILITYTITLSDMTKDPLATGCDGSTGIVGLTSGTGTLSDNQSESVSELSGVYRGRYDLSMQFLGEILREAASANNTVCLEARPDTPVGRNEICGDCGEELNNRPANPEKLLVGAVLSGVDLLQDLDHTLINDKIDLNMALGKFLTTGDKITGFTAENSSYLPSLSSRSGLDRVSKFTYLKDEYDDVQTRCTSISNLSGLNSTFTFELSLPKRMATIYLPNSKAAAIEAAAGDHILITYTITLSDMTKDPSATSCDDVGGS